MRAFFRGWKRKVGCVALLIACLLMAAWTRSFSKTELVIILGEYVFISENGKFTVSQRLRVRRTLNSGESKGYSMSSLSSSAWISPWSFNPTSTSVLPGGDSLTPYWSIVLPLTAISAWLLLSKPGTKIDPPFTPTRKNA